MSARRNRRGMTLVELGISIAVLGIVLALTMQSLMTSQDYQRLGSAQDDLSSEAERILRQAQFDLSTSGWCFPLTTPLTNYQVANFAADRSLRYWPCVIQPDGQTVSGGMPVAAVGLPGRSPSHPASLVQRIALPASLPDSRPPAQQVAHFTFESRPPLPTDPAWGDYVASYHARSQELAFLKTVASGWEASPRNQVDPQVGFPGSTADWQTPNNHSSLRVKAASQYKFDAGGNVVPRNQGTAEDGQPYGILLSSAWLDLQDNKPVLKPLWEPMASSDLYNDPGFATASNSVNDLDPTRLRDYLYAVVNPPRTNASATGRLVRAYRVSNPAAFPAGVEVNQRISDDGLPFGYVIDLVLSDHVTRVLFETRRHDAGLAVDQVRMRLYMARRIEGVGDRVIPLQLSSVLTMRARLTPDDMAADVAQLGPAVPFAY